MYGINMAIPIPESLPRYTVLDMDINHTVMMRSVFEQYIPICVAGENNRKAFVYSKMNITEKDAVAPLVNLAYTLLTEHGYPLAKESADHCPYIEQWRYKSSSALPPVGGAFGEHEDDYGAVSWRVCTAIFYLQNTCEGGGLYVKERENLSELTLLPVRPGMCVLLRGDVTHKPQDCSGDGVRDCIVVQLARD
jgi:hypothetical protein